MLRVYEYAHGNVCTINIRAYHRGSSDRALPAETDLQPYHNLPWDNLLCVYQNKNWIGHDPDNFFSFSVVYRARYGGNYL